MLVKTLLAKMAVDLLEPTNLHDPKTLLVWVVFDILPQVSTCFTFMTIHPLMYRLFGVCGLFLQDVVKGTGQWPDFEEMR